MLCESSVLVLKEIEDILSIVNVPVTRLIDFCEPTEVER